MGFSHATRMEAQISFWETFSTGIIDGGEVDPNLVWSPLYDLQTGKEQVFYDFIGRTQVMQPAKQTFSTCRIIFILRS
jgi:hypothetical protein